MCVEPDVPIGTGIYLETGAANALCLLKLLHACWLASDWSEIERPSVVDSVPCVGCSNESAGERELCDSERARADV